MLFPEWDLGDICDVFLSFFHKHMGNVQLLRVPLFLLF